MNMTVAEIAVRLAAGYAARMNSWQERVVIEAEQLHAELTKRGHIKPKQPKPNGPDWSKAPEWAQWHAIDLCGDVFWYEKCPTHNGEGDWDNNDGGRYSHAGQVQCHGWRESLQRRPEGAP